MLWLYKTALVWLSVLSLLFFLFSLAAVPWIVARIPVDYFMKLSPGEAPNKKVRVIPLGKTAARVMKNMAGIILVMSGFIMLFIPGQGILTMLAGMMLMDFPGKKRLILQLVGFSSIRRGLNWLRTRKGIPPFKFPC